MTALHTKHGRSSSGFTLMELTLVLTLIAILAVIAVPIYQRYIINAREAVLKEDLYQMREAIDKYYADKGKYPESLQTLVEERYIRGVPSDPFTKSKDTWATVPDESGGGIYDIRSGSDLTAGDGTIYSKW